MLFLCDPSNCLSKIVFFHNGSQSKFTPGFHYMTHQRPIKMERNQTTVSSVTLHTLCVCVQWLYPHWIYPNLSSHLVSIIWLIDGQIFISLFTSQNEWSIFTFHFSLLEVPLSTLAGHWNYPNLSSHLVSIIWLIDGRLSTINSFTTSSMAIIIVQ